MNLLLRADARQIPLQDKCVNCCVTSPPYWGLRDYGIDGQLGLEKTPDEYIQQMVQVFREVKRVLRDDGTLWLNLGDSYHNGDKGGYRNGRVGGASRIQANHLANDFVGAPNRQPQEGLKPKDLVGIPWMLAFALREDGWYLRSDIIWSKPNPMPESVTDRPTKAHEYIFLLSKSERYYYDADAIAEPSTWAGKIVTLGEKSLSRGQANGANVKASGNGIKDAVQVTDTRNKRSVWEVNSQPFPEAHFATFPEELIKPCILAGCPAGGTVLDPFVGSGTTALVARDLQCNAIGLELNAEYLKIAAKRLSQEVLDFSPAVK